MNGRFRLDRTPARRGFATSAAVGLLAALLAGACGGSGGGYGPPPPPPPAPERYAPPPGPPPVPPEEDPPARVGRISFLEGAVSFRPAESDDWGPAVPNRPVTSGDRVWTDADGRAEIDVGAAALRTGPQTEADVVRLDDAAVQVRLPQGTLTERVRDLEGGLLDEIDAPAASVSISQPGVYRVEVSPDGASTRVTVWSGRATVSSSGSSFDVNAGQMASIEQGNPPTYGLVEAGAPDDFDRWSSARDQREDQATHWRQYVSADMPGAYDLDQYGRWQDDPAYGPVWYPTSVTPGWAPYRTGHWVWVQRWGWTWVDNAPWGYAPYHYGRWAYVNGSWGWCPGRTRAAPVYAPALVVFIGRPPGGAAPAQNVTWFPLAPNEVYQPVYPTSTNYRQRINVTSVTNVTNITNVTNTTTVTNVVVYRNQTVVNAVTAVPQQTFVNAQPVGRAVVPVAARDVSHASVLGAAPRIVPTRASLVTAAVAARPASGPPPTLAQRLVVATHEAPPPPLPFSVQERALATNGGRPLAVSQVAALHPSPTPRADVVALRPNAPPAIKSPVVSPRTPQAATSAPVAPTSPGSPTPATAAVPASPSGAAPTSPPASPPPSIVQPSSPGATTTVAQPPRPLKPQPIPPQPPPPQAQAQPAGPPSGSPQPPTTTGQPPATRVAAPPSSPPPTGSSIVGPRTVHTPLDDAYTAERKAMDARHQNEGAHPQAGEPLAAQLKRQADERRELEDRYSKAKLAGAKTLPPAPPKPVDKSQ